MGLRRNRGNRLPQPFELRRSAGARGPGVRRRLFYDIETKGKQIARVTLSKLVGSTVHQVAVYTRRKGAWTKYVLDPERFGALLRGKNHDQRESPCKDRYDQIKKNMKWFFPGSATDGKLQTVLGEIKHFASDLKYRFEVSLSADFIGDIHGPDSPDSPPWTSSSTFAAVRVPDRPSLDRKTTGARYVWRS